MEDNLVLGWFDPSIGSRNTGDEIIADAVEKELRLVAPMVTILRFPTQTWLSRQERKTLSACNHFIVGGTNLLNGNIPWYLQWKLDPQVVGAISGRTSLLGVGWWQYDNEPNALSEFLWKRILSKGAHSVRDEYTQGILKSIGIAGEYTACVTMWDLAPTTKFSEKRPSSVLMTVTDYHRDAVSDSKLIRGLRARYENVVAWPQSIRDVKYLQTLDRSMQLLDPKLSSFNDALKSGEFDYVGTRLHAGVRALQVGVKSTIVAVDNRAREIARSTGLPVIGRGLKVADWSLVDDRNELRLVIPGQGVERWRESFEHRISQ